MRKTKIIGCMVVGLAIGIGEALAASVSIDPSSGTDQVVVLEGFGGTNDPSTSLSPGVSFDSMGGGAATYSYAANHLGEGYIYFSPTANAFDPNVYKYLRTRLSVERDTGSVAAVQVYPTPVAGDNLAGATVTTGALREVTFDLSALNVNGTGLRLDVYNYDNDGTADAAALDYIMVDRYRTKGIEFGHDGDLNGVGTINVSSATVSNGVLLGTAANTDPQLNVTSLSVDADIYKFAEIRMKAASGGAGMYWDTAAQAGGAMWIPFGVNDGTYHTYLVDFSDESGWTGAASFLRLDPTNLDGVDFEVDYIRFVALPVVNSTNVFHETFDNPGATDAGIASVGWHANSGSTGTALSESNTSLANGPVVSGGDYLIYGLTTPANLLTWTETTGIGSISDVLKISVSVRNDQPTADLKVAIQVDGAWFVTQDVANSPTVSNWVPVNFAVQDIAWNALSFVSGSTLVEGGSASLPSSGTVNAVGVYDAVSSKVRFDDFKVYVNADTSESLYQAWNAANNLSGPDADLSADPDSDTLDNLVEYALGGNPTNADASAVLPVSSLVNDGGTNWFAYVYHRRLDAATRGLTYEVVREDGLIFGTWTNSGITEAGTVVLDAEFEAVTNRVPTDAKAEQFMKLNIGFE
ncbi:MAG: hypothetical protein K9M54_05495 [Kiritimatiellales bacterium]|nr:hypothetical protein [Kiritimatiellales bacterium]MCF7863898.1 hypothetical protein [Kiritimatiellales bacterium]